MGHHILFQAMFMMNIITTSVFWATLFDQAIEECEGDELKIFNVYLAHILPGVSGLIAFLITDVTIRTSHVKMIIAVGLLYGYINYVETKKRGTPLYWFLTWEDET